MDNYTPISVLLTASKLLEKVVHDQGPVVHCKSGSVHVTPKLA